MNGTDMDFPVDDATLLAVEHALGAYCEVDDEGEHHLEGADYDLHQLLEFMSGFDEKKLVFESEDDDGTLNFTYPEPLYHEHDIIRSLIGEVRRLRVLTDQDGSASIDA